VRDHKGITVVLGVGDERRRTELHAALDAVVTVVRSEPTVARAMRAVAEHVPDVVVLDEHDGRHATADACWHTLSHNPATRSVVLATADDEAAYETMLNGAFAVLRADTAPNTLVDAVVGASRGESLVLAGIARLLVEDTKYVAAANRDPLAKLVRLTSTEQEVLTRLAGGLSPAEIAALHGVTARLVNLHTGYAVAKVHHHAQRVRVRDELSLADA
jgi:DNA-binding NarL/FixJ family response regulator